METIDQCEVQYRHGKTENPRFWSRLGGAPALTGLKVLDLGCGLGSLCVDMGLAGARKVVGVDIGASRIEFATENLAANYPDLASTVEFRCVKLQDLPDHDFDVAVSKDTLEHVEHLSDVLEAVVDRLKPGGSIYFGFGPLYHSPYGDHHRLKAGFPWGHVLLPEKYLINRLRKSGMAVSNVHDLGLNKLSIYDYLALFKNSGLHVHYLGVNVSRNPVSRLFGLLRRIPLVGIYFAHNLYCVLKKPDGGL